MVVRAAGPAEAAVVDDLDLVGDDLVLAGIGCFRGIKERQFLHIDVTLLRQAYRERRFADEPLIGQIFTSAGYSLNAEVPLEVVLDFGGGACLADLVQVVDHWYE